MRHIANEIPCAPLAGIDATVLVVCVSMSGISVCLSVTGRYFCFYPIKGIHQIRTKRVRPECAIQE
jgi:hypothetical protein